MKKFIAIIALVSVLSLVGCSGDANSKTNTDTPNNDILDELDENEKKELEDAQKKLESEINGDTTKSDADSESGVNLENLRLDDPKYYTYYDELAKSYTESGVTNSGGTLFYTMGISEPVYINGNVFLAITGSRSAHLYSYDIASGSLNKVFEFNKASSQGKYDYDSWYKKGDDMYLLYDSTAHGASHIEKVDKDGNVVEDYDISTGYVVNKISHVFDNGKILLTSKDNDSFEIYNPADKKLTMLEVIPVPSDHAGITKDVDNPIFMFGKGNSFYFGNQQLSMLGDSYISENTIYEYNTDTGEATVFYTDELLKNKAPSIEIYGNYLILSYMEDYIEKFSVVNIKDGNKIVNNLPKFSPYIGGEGSYYRNTKTQKWYKLKYPDSTYPLGFKTADPLIEVGEELSEEASEAGNIVQINDKYYVYYDDAGYFLRSYEKGDSDEQLIISKKQIEEDQAK